MLLIKRKIFNKLLISIIGVSITPLLLVGWISYEYSSKAINEELDQQAEIVMEQKRTSLALFFLRS